MIRMKIGKKGKAWIKARKRLKKEYSEKGITWCEIQLPGCMGNFALSFAHRYKRRDPRCEHTFEKTCLACAFCHNKTEYDRKLNEEVFNRLRGKDEHKI